jgi:hypothetical protein
MTKVVNTVYNEQNVIVKINTNKLGLLFLITSKPPPPPTSSSRGKYIQHVQKH